MDGGKVLCIRWPLNIRVLSVYVGLEIFRDLVRSMIFAFRRFAERFAKRSPSLGHVFKKWSTNAVGRQAVLQVRQPGLSSTRLPLWKRIVKTAEDTDGKGTKRIVGHWLVGCSGLVFGIVVLGGLTRLTESGLSMVDWSFMHFRPPSTEGEWQAYFEKYQQFPEYQLANRGMSLEEFKQIYWFEHAHRVYGRLLGLFVALPATFFIMKKWTSPGIRRVLLGCTALVGFQV